MKIHIPFSGFYGTVHGDNLDECIHQFFRNEAGGDSNDGLVHRAQECCFQHFFVEYSRRYTESFSTEFGLSTLNFLALQSPREYNFITDRIVCDIGGMELMQIRKNVEPRALAAYVKERLAPANGFLPFYSDDVADWPDDVVNWDIGQIYLLMEVFAGWHFDLDGYEEYDLMEDSLDDMTEWAGECIPEIHRLCKIGDYVYKRSLRSTKKLVDSVCE